MWTLSPLTRRTRFQLLSVAGLLVARRGRLRARTFLDFGFRAATVLAAAGGLLRWRFRGARSLVFRGGRSRA